MLRVKWFEETTAFTAVRNDSVAPISQILSADSQVLRQAVKLYRFPQSAQKNKKNAAIHFQEL